MEPKEALKGIRVCDFTWIVAGPQCTRLLANLGAEVIRIEPPHAPELIRMIPLNPETKFGPNVSGFFNNLNPDKLSVTLNTRHPKGFDLLLRLIQKCDIVAENFNSRVLENWGLSYDELVKIKPDIIYLSLSGYGHSGRLRDYQTWGPSAQAISGLTHLSGLPDQPPAGWGYSYVDHFAGYMAAVALLSALHYRHLTGRGQWLDLSQAECSLALTGPTLLDYTVNGRPSRRPGFPPGNHSGHPRVAPHNAYRCQGQDRSGQDLWIAISVLAEEQWQGLCRVAVDLPWTRDPRFATNLGRVDNEDELDGMIQAWTQTQERYSLMYRLQEAGVPAGAVQSAEDRVEVDPQLAERELYQELDHAELGRFKTETPPFKLSRTPARLHHSSPLFGEHNRHVFGEILGLSEEEIQQCYEEGVF